MPAASTLVGTVTMTARARKSTGRDRYERDLALLARVRDSYRRQSGQSGWVVIDAERSKDEVAATVAHAVLPLLVRPSAHGPS